MTLMCIALHMPFTMPQACCPVSSRDAGGGGGKGRVTGRGAASPLPSRTLAAGLGDQRGWVVGLVISLSLSLSPLDALELHGEEEPGVPSQSLSTRGGTHTPPSRALGALGPESTRGPRVVGSPCHSLNVTSAPAVLVELERSNREHKKGGAGKGELEQRKGAAAAPVAQVMVARSSWGRVHAALSDSTCA